MSIFKPCDIRGVYPDALNEELAGAIGRGIGTELGGRTCVVGGDVRCSTPALKRAVIEGLARAGAQVLDLGIAPTPAVYWAHRRLGAYGAVIVTASHNPPEYNGVKFALGDRPAGPEDLGRLEKRVRDSDFVDGGGHVERREVRGDYIEWLRESFDGTGRGLRVLVDAGNGCAWNWAPEVLSSAGYGVEKLYCEPDGTFPNRSPNPAEAGALDAAGRAVVDRGADFGVGFDGDADRAIFFDEQGAIIEGDQAVILLARDILAREKGATIAYDLKCTSRVREEIERAGGRAIGERSGYSFIKSRLLDEGAALAGEASGHLFFRELGGDDAIYAALRMGEVLRRSGLRMSALAATIPPYCISPDIRLPRPRGDGQRVIEHLSRTFTDRPRDFTDGVRIEFEDGWALCRLSVTEPVITLRFEGDTPEALAAIRERVLADIPD